jgi:hypothetical protein
MPLLPILEIDHLIQLVKTQKQPVLLLPFKITVLSNIMGTKEPLPHQKLKK